MDSQSDRFYQAVLARDYRFDGKFFVGVKTTGIYCRPICPARPKRENVEFFKSAHAAERAGFRPCLRCRPECAPGSPAWSGQNSTIERALKLISQNALAGLSEDEFAARLGVSARHLRRLFESEIGRTPKQIHDTNRLNFARKLITETRLPMTEIAFSSGFASVRRFNDAVRKRFHRSPRALRDLKRPSVSESWIELSLAYRPPFDWQESLNYHRRHQISGIETISDSVYERVYRIGKTVGVFQISPSLSKPELRLRVSGGDAQSLFHVVQRVRRVFDLDSDPLLINNAFSHSSYTKGLVKSAPGLRLPAAWDPFETAIATILGQLVSLAQARRLVRCLVENCGEKVEHPLTGEALSLFPSSENLSDAALDFLPTTRARKNSIREFSKRVARGELSLDLAQDPEAFRRSLLEIPGIGPWSAEYISMRVLADTDAFPKSDLLIKRALHEQPGLDPEKMRPWRAYLAVYLWKESMQ